MFVSLLPSLWLAFSLPTQLHLARNQNTNHILLKSPVTGTPPQTVDEAKKAFQKAYDRVADSPQQTFINEIISSTQFALIAPNYQYSKVFAVGYESLCETFLTSVCRTPADGISIRASLLTALAMDEATIAADAKDMLASVAGKSEEEVFALEEFEAIKNFAHPKGFKYTYTFGAGMISVMKAAGVEPSVESIERWCTALGLGCSGVMVRDFSYFKSSIEKLDQLKEMLLQMKVKAKRDEAKKLKSDAEKAEKEASDAEAALEDTPATPEDS